MILRLVHAAPEALAVRGEIPAWTAALDPLSATVLLYGLERGYVSEADVAPLLSPNALHRANAAPALDAVARGMAAELESVAQEIVDGIVPDGMGFSLLGVGLPNDGRFHAPVECPALTVELCALYHAQVALDRLPLVLGIAVCVALQLVQDMLPLLVGKDIQEFLWFEQELAEDAHSLALATDLDAMTPQALERLIDADPNAYMGITEQFHLGGDAAWLLGRLRELNAPSPVAKVTADRYVSASQDTKTALLLEWLDQWRVDAPSLADHPLARWVAKVAEVTSAQVAEGRDRRAPLHLPDEGEFTLPDQGIVVTLGEPWEDQSLEYLFERLNQAEESALCLLPLDPFAFHEAHARLMALAEGTALLECLTELNNQ